VTQDDLRQLFAGADWLWVLDTIANDTPVQFHEGGLAVEALALHEGPWIVIVHGDLHATGDIVLETGDYKCSLLVVFGSVRARSFRFMQGASCVVVHDLVVDDCVLGRYGDESATLEVGGRLQARALLLDHVTGVTAGTLDAVVCSARGWQLPLDIDYQGEDHGNWFVPAVLRDDGRIDMAKIWHHSGDVFRPNAIAQLRARRVMSYAGT
jgi:hypothetical protein